MSDSVVVSPSGSLLRLRSPVLALSLLDSSLHLEERDTPLQSGEPTVRNKNSSGGEAEQGTGPLGDQLVLTVATEKGRFKNIEKSSSVFDCLHDNKCCPHLHYMVLSYSRKDRFVLMLLDAAAGRRLLRPAQPAAAGRDGPAGVRHRHQGHHRGLDRGEALHPRPAPLHKRGQDQRSEVYSNPLTNFTLNHHT